MVPSLYINNNRATEWGTICQRAESISGRPTLPLSVEEFMERIEFPAHWWVPCPWVPLPHPLCRVCAGPHQGPTCHTISPVLSSPRVHVPKPQSSTIALMLCHSGRTLANSKQRWGGTSKHGRMGQIGPIGWLGLYLHISGQPRLQNSGQFAFRRLSRRNNFLYANMTAGSWRGAAGVTLPRIFLPFAPVSTLPKRARLPPPAVTVLLCLTTQF